MDSNQWVLNSLFVIVWLPAPASGRPALQADHIDCCLLVAGVAPGEAGYWSARLLRYTASTSHFGRLLHIRKKDGYRMAFATVSSALRDSPQRIGLAKIAIIEVILDQHFRIP
jgi:hypothetical protein